MCRNTCSKLDKVISRRSVIRDSSIGLDIQITSGKLSSNSVSPPITLYIPSTNIPGIYMIAVSPTANGYVRGQAYKALYATILGPFFLTILLMFVSGLTLQERPGAKKRYEKNNHWEEYSRYLNRTSILIPFPPQIYEKLPTIVKRTVFLEFPIYVFNPKKHSDVGKGQGGAEEGGNENGGNNKNADSRQSGDQLVGDNSGSRN